MTRSRPPESKDQYSSQLPPPLPRWNPDAERQRERAALLRLPAAGSTDTATDIRVRRLLAWCGASRTPALIATSHPPRVILARFLALRGDQLTLTVDAQFADARTALIGDESPCVAFSMDRRSTAFHAQVHRVSFEDGIVVATFGVPLEVTHSDSRMSSRVTVAASCGLTMTMTGNGQSVEVMPRDLSLTGAQATLITETAAFNAGQTVIVTLALNDRSVTVSAQIRRRKGASLGVFFPDCVGGKGAPEALRKILSEVEARRPAPLPTPSA